MAIPTVNYRRVSDDQQVMSGAGLAAQRDACYRFAERNALEIVAEFEEEDGVCGELPPERRPKLLDAIGALKRGGVLLVQKRDRIARDPLVIAYVEAAVKSRKARLVSAAGEGTDSLDPNDPYAFILRGISDLFARFELLQIRLRTSAALRAKRRAGERNGRVPYGWDLHDDGRRSKMKVDKKTGEARGGLPIGLRENPHEQEGLRLIQSLSSSGRSLAHIADALNRQGYLTKAGKPWQRSSVGYVLRVSIPLLGVVPNGPKTSTALDLTG